MKSCDDIKYEYRNEKDGEKIQDNDSDDESFNR